MNDNRKLLVALIVWIRRLGEEEHINTFPSFPSWLCPIPNSITLLVSIHLCTPFCRIASLWILGISKRDTAEQHMLRNDEVKWMFSTPLSKPDHVSSLSPTWNLNSMMILLQRTQIAFHWWFCALKTKIPKIPLTQAAFLSARGRWSEIVFYVHNKCFISCIFPLLT